MVTRLTRETRHIPGIGQVRAVIREGVRSDGTVFLRLLTEATSNGVPISADDIGMVRELFNAE